MFLYPAGRHHTPRKCRAVSEGKPNLSRQDEIEKEDTGLYGNRN